MTDFDDIATITLRPEGVSIPDVEDLAAPFQPTRVPRYEAEITTKAGAQIDEIWTRYRLDAWRTWRAKKR